MKTMRSPSTPAPSFRRHLQEELARRCAANSAYSLRAFARRLEIHHSTLSQLLRGRRALTPRTIRALGQRLGLDAAQLEGYARAAPAPVPAWGESMQLAQDTARVVADWKHFALLELTRLEHFRADSRWIARVLGITADEVNLVLTRLARLRLLDMRHDRWTDLTGDTVANSHELGLAALQHLSARLDARRTIPPGSSHESAGHHTVTTIAVDSAGLPAAVVAIERFRAELLAALARGGKRDSVIQLEIHLTPVASSEPQGEE